MKFIMRWLKRRLDDVGYGIGTSSINPKRNTEVVSLDQDLLYSKGINFKVYKADGGFVVETYFYDKNHDRSSGLHIIYEDQNFGEKINQILSIESLKR